MNKNNKKVLRATIYVDYEIDINDRRKKKFHSIIRRSISAVQSVSDNLRVVGVEEFTPILDSTTTNWEERKRIENLKIYKEEYKVHIDKPEWMV